MISVHNSASARASAQAYDAPVEKLAQSGALNEQQKVAKLSKSFEAMLLRNILENAQKPVFKSNLAPQTATGSIYRDMVTTQLAESISQSGTLGISSILESQLRRPPAPDAAESKAESVAQPERKLRKLHSPKHAS